MTLERWLQSREPAPPGALVARLQSVLGDGAQSLSEAPEVCLAAAESLLDGLLRSDALARESALDLLAADALVTYAFEAAGDEPERLAARAERAMTRLSALGSA